MAQRTLYSGVGLALEQPIPISSRRTTSPRQIVADSKTLLLGPSCTLGLCGAADWGWLIAGADGSSQLAIAGMAALTRDLLIICLVARLVLTHRSTMKKE
ncbi:hypothetical protein NDU88_006294 [Pleurodeles waltl]|uniref:Uncharacterized protein n=1 Tax=Pleurodeles waltl TaxID=8319 RepID=A0AAV7TF43_PLEWA|nr:hypothetical protein NDU88_006294 [Pleurodeles waltl]